MARSLAVSLSLLLFCSCAHAPAWIAQSLPGLQAADRSALFAERIRIVEEKKEFTQLLNEPATEPAVAEFFLKRFIDTLSGYGVKIVPSDETLTVRLTMRKAVSRRDYCETHKATVGAHVISFILQGRAATGTAVQCPVGEFNVFVESRRPNASAFGWVAELKGVHQLRKDDVSDQNRALTGAVLDAAVTLLEDPELLAKLLVQPSREGAPVPQEPGSGRRPVAPTSK